MLKQRMRGIWVSLLLFALLISPLSYAASDRPFFHFADEIAAEISKFVDCTDFYALFQVNKQFKRMVERAISFRLTGINQINLYYSVLLFQSEASLKRMAKYLLPYPHYSGKDITLLSQGRCLFLGASSPPLSVTLYTGQVQVHPLFSVVSKDAQAWRAGDDWIGESVQSQKLVRLTNTLTNKQLRFTNAIHAKVVSPTRVVVSGSKIVTFELDPVTQTERRLLGRFSLPKCSGQLKTALCLDTQSNEPKLTIVSKDSPGVLIDVDFATMKVRKERYPIWNGVTDITLDLSKDGSLLLMGVSSLPSEIAAIETATRRIRFTIPFVAPVNKLSMNDDATHALILADCDLYLLNLINGELTSLDLNLETFSDMAIEHRLDWISNDLFRFSTVDMVNERGYSIRDVKHPLMDLLTTLDGGNLMRERIGAWAEGEDLFACDIQIMGQNIILDRSKGQFFKLDWKQRTP